MERKCVHSHGIQESIDKTTHILMLAVTNVHTVPEAANHLEDEVGMTSMPLQSHIILMLAVTNVHTVPEAANHLEDEVGMTSMSSITEWPLNRERNNRIGVCVCVCVMVMCICAYAVTTERQYLLF